ncbi:MAG TPA: hypothetical protein VM434_10295 [Beijerinckiaceae bacterium]|nr:hypothetical protein [Beijerinckiaceae bacterium]
MTTKTEIPGATLYDGDPPVETHVFASLEQAVRYAVEDVAPERHPGVRIEAGRARLAWPDIALVYEQLKGGAA